MAPLNRRYHSLFLLSSVLLFFVAPFLETVQPGSLTEEGTTLTAKIPVSKMLYFSLNSLTTLGFGDIVPITPPARMLAALEATSGVLYVAITAARLLASYQTTAESD